MLPVLQQPNSLSSLSAATSKTTVSTKLEMGQHEDSTIMNTEQERKQPILALTSHWLDMQSMKLDQRDQSDSSATSTCKSISTAATAADDSVTSSSTSGPPLHQALQNYAMDSLLLSAAGNNASRIDLEKDVLSLITAETARVFDDAGHLPLHVACQAGLSYAVVERLVAAYPEGLRTTTRNRRRLLPLHILCKYYTGPNRERAKLLSFFLRHYPAATRVPTPSTGELPFHLLCDNYFCSTANLALVHKYYPAAISTPTKKRGYLPVHIACEKKYMVRQQDRSSKRGIIEDEPGSSSDEIIRFLVRNYPEGLKTTNGQGELPFHVAIRGYQSLDTLRFLLQNHVDALSATDASGRTPLHLAVSRHEPCRSTILSLLETDPSALSVVDRNGKTPIDYANHHRRESWVRELLFQPNPVVAGDTTTTTAVALPAAVETKAGINVGRTQSF